MSFGRWPYRVALAAVRAQASRIHPGPSVWPRNSYLTGAFRPLRSDLDLTLWFEDMPGQSTLTRLQKLLKRTKRVFPALGESNIYVANAALILAGFSNRFELARDPALARLLSQRAFIKRLTSERAEASVYLLRMLEANMHKLTNGWAGQEAKWRQHFLQVNMPAPTDFTIADPMTVILGLALGWLREAGQDDLYQNASVELNWYYRGRLQGRADDSVGPNPYLAALMPQRFCYHDNSLEFLNTNLAEIFFAQVAWEIWGLSSQLWLYHDPPGLLLHLKNIDNLLTMAESREIAPQFRSGLAALCAFAAPEK